MPSSPPLRRLITDCEGACTHASERHSRRFPHKCMVPGCECRAYIFSRPQTASGLVPLMPCGHPATSANLSTRKCAYETTAGKCGHPVETTGGPQC